MGHAAEEFEASVRAGEQFRTQKKFEAALREFSLAYQQAGNDTERGLALAMQGEVHAWDLNDYKMARRLADRALALKAAAAVARVTALKVCARCQMLADRDFDSAIRTLKDASALEEVDWAQPTVALMLGDCYRSVNRFQDAVAAYRRVTGMKSASRDVKAVACLNSGLIYRYSLQDRGQAELQFNSAVKFNADFREEVRQHLAKPVAVTRPLILAHYMPWYVAKPYSGHWGWHWTMNHFDPESSVTGRRSIASQFYPLIGPYDSADPDVLEYHLLLMKLAGIDGVIVDWYGLQKFNDYALLHERTLKLVEQISRLRMKLVICYEDQTIPRLVDGGRITANQRVTHATAEINWLADHWFQLDSYVEMDGRPVLLSFGHSGLSDREWTDCLTGLKSPVSYFSEHFRRNGAAGAFDWPVPSKGVQATDAFLRSAKHWTHAIPVAVPRFVDVYKVARVSAGYDRIEDSRGATFRQTLQRALAAKTAVVQIATWNDWGEGTVIEPSREFGYRDLEVIQSMRRRHIDTSFEPTATDLRLPRRLLNRRRDASDTGQQKHLDRVAEWISQGNLSPARVALSGSE